MTTVTRPDIFLPIDEVQIDKELEPEISRTLKDTTSKEKLIEAAGATEYAVWGWA